ncbi:S1 RNA-binding domain-containing protein 1 [Trichoplax sp. H2]|nr:S1 RNA-binding domain-containing protein 1 [Trichoplax sp. H2]|eukprot:RDD44859.1 S1 RNA-binding domain-containing protein 1 [Trichoplax sp. H2]
MASQRHDQSLQAFYIKRLAQRYQANEVAVKNAIALLREGNTVPFIVRYKSSMIQGINDINIQQIRNDYEDFILLQEESKKLKTRLQKSGALTLQLEQELDRAESVEEIKELAKQFKTTPTGSLADRAKKLGLDKLATLLLENKIDQVNFKSWIKRDTQGLASIEDIQNGVKHILANVIAKNSNCRSYVGKLFKNAEITSFLSSTTIKQQMHNPSFDNVLERYSNFQRKVTHVLPHQVLALNRGEREKILTVKIKADFKAQEKFCTWARNEIFPFVPKRKDVERIFNEATKDAFVRLLQPAEERRIRVVIARRNLTCQAQKAAVSIFTQNLRRMLLTPSVSGKVILGIDPGYKNGCKLAIIDKLGEVLHATIIYIHDARISEAEATLVNLVQGFNKMSFSFVNESGSSWYSISELGRAELPKLMPNLRSAVSIARRLQNPLAEMTKVEPKHLGVGMYQHDIPDKLLEKAVKGVLEACVSFVGIDCNTADVTMLQHVAGLNLKCAKAIVEYRKENGPLCNREQLKKIKGIGPKTFEQCAGFLRINPASYEENLSNYTSLTVSTSSGKRKICTDSSIVARKKQRIIAESNKLDMTIIHPDNYPSALKFLRYLGATMDDIGDQKLIEKVTLQLNIPGFEALQKCLGIDSDVFKNLCDALQQNLDFDIRSDYDEPVFRSSIISLQSIVNGTILTGCVRNVTTFGIFVDCGLGTDGMIRIGEEVITQSESEKRPLGPGDRVKVKVKRVSGVNNKRILLELAQ